jgi:hypothetical protein
MADTFLRESKKEIPKIIPRTLSGNFTVHNVSILCPIPLDALY